MTLLTILLHFTNRKILTILALGKATQHVACLMK
jgi:hypothetical protein